MAHFFFLWNYSFLHNLFHNIVKESHCIFILELNKIHNSCLKICWNCFGMNTEYNVARFYEFFLRSMYKVRDDNLCYLYCYYLYRNQGKVWESNNDVKCWLKNSSNQTHILNTKKRSIITHFISKIASHYLYLHLITL